MGLFDLQQVDIIKSDLNNHQALTISQPELNDVIRNDQGLNKLLIDTPIISFKHSWWTLIKTRRKSQPVASLRLRRNFRSTI